MIPPANDSPPRENWARAYREAPEIFDAFSRAEDPEGLVARSFLAHAELTGRRVVELGCGTGRYSRELASRAGLYVGVEPSASMLAFARAASDEFPVEPLLLRARGETLPFKTASVDIVLAAWVVVNLRAEIREGVLQEAARVLRPGPRCGLWLIENHWDSQFQHYRGRGPEDESRLRDLLDHRGFELVDVVSTHLRFPSPSEAERVLGYLCGEIMLEQLRRAPTAVLDHRIVILYRPA